MEGRADGLAGGRVPQPHRAVAVGAGQQLAVGAERHPVHAVPGRVVGLDGRADGLAGGRVPQPHRAVAAGAGQQLAVGAERHRRHAVLGAGLEGRADGAAGGRVPQPHRAVAAGAGQQLAVGAERHRGAVRLPSGNVARLALACRGAPTGRPVAGFHSRTVPSPPALASSLPSGLNATPVHGDRVGGQHALLLLLGQQGRDGGSGLAGGGDGPGGDGEPARGHRIGAVDVEAFGGELAGQGDGMLPFGAGRVARGGGGVVDGDPGGGERRSG